MDSKQLQHFYSMVSFSGLLSLYAMKLSFERQTAFDRLDLATNVAVLPEGYFHGFIVACSAMDILSYNLKKTIVTVVSVDSLILKTIEEEMRKQIKKEKYWEDQLNILIKYFE